jgi:hypothetical protein
MTVALQQSIGPFSQDQLLLAAVVLVVIAVGFWLIYTGLKNLNRGYAIWSHDQIDAGSLHTEDGVVEVQGTAEPIDEVASAKYTGTDCLAYTYKKERKRRRQDEDGNTQTEWDTVESGSYSIPLYASDDTGKAAVDPTEATLSLDSTRVSGGHRTRKYEGRLEPGDTVHVFGQKQQAATKGGLLADERAFIGDGSGDSTFTVSDTTETRTVLRFLAKGAGLLLFGLLVFGTLIFLSLQGQL